MAVKRLQHDVDILGLEAQEEFISEIKFMRTLRHRNVVYFYGAGFVDQQPFLVLEYMSRGALRSVLKNDTIDLPWDRRLGFLVDTANGMNFLHTLQPPRIHRLAHSAPTLCCFKHLKLLMYLEKSWCLYCRFLLFH